MILNDACCGDCVFFKWPAKPKPDGFGECFVDPPRIEHFGNNEWHTAPAPDASEDRPACRFFKSRFLVSDKEVKGG